MLSVRVSVSGRRVKGARPPVSGRCHTWSWHCLGRWEKERPPHHTAAKGWQHVPPCSTALALVARQHRPKQLTRASPPAAAAPPAGCGGGAVVPGCRSKGHRPGAGGAGAAGAQGGHSGRRARCAGRCWLHYVWRGQYWGDLLDAAGSGYAWKCAQGTVVAVHVCFMHTCVRVGVAPRAALMGKNGFNEQRGAHFRPQGRCQRRSC